jgi:hypothetical protein
VVQDKNTLSDVRFKGYYYHSSLFVRIHSETGGENCIYEQKWESVGRKNCILVYEQKWESVVGKNCIHKEKWENTLSDVRFKGYYYHSSLFVRIHSETNMQFLLPTLSHFCSYIQLFLPTLSLFCSYTSIQFFPPALSHFSLCIHGRQIRYFCLVPRFYDIQ